MPFEIKPITKTDGSRLFVEIGKKFRNANPLLPVVKKGDEVLVVTKHSLGNMFIEKKLLGKYIRYYELVAEDSHLSLRSFEGKVVRYATSAHARVEGIQDVDLKRFLLVDYSSTENPSGEIVCSFDWLENCYGLEVLPDKLAQFEKTTCSRPRCRKVFSKSFKFCPYCSEKNSDYRKTLVENHLKEKVKKNLTNKEN